MRQDEPEEIGVLFWFKLVNLLDMNGQSSCGVQSPRTHIALEVFGLLVLH